MRSGAAIGVRYRIVPGRLGLVDVIDRTTGLPAEAGVTAVLLEPREARELVRWLLRRAHAEGSGNPERSAHAIQDGRFVGSRGSKETELAVQY